jgi:hypothetical protein
MMGNRLTAVVALLMLPAVSGCTSRAPITTASREEARGLWGRSGVGNYDLEWIGSGGRSGHHLVYVRGGVVRQARLVHADGREELLDPVAASRCDVGALFELAAPVAGARGEFDALLGYPASYRSPTQRLEVIRLDPTPPLKDPPPPLPRR